MVTQLPQWLVKNLIPCTLLSGTAVCFLVLQLFIRFPCGRQAPPIPYHTEKDGHRGTQRQPTMARPWSYVLRAIANPRQLLPYEEDTQPLTTAGGEAPEEFLHLYSTLRGSNLSYMPCYPKQGPCKSLLNLSLVIVCHLRHRFW